MRLPVHADRRLLAGSLDETKHFARLVVEPVVQVLHVVLVLRGEVSLVRAGDAVPGQPGNVLVDVEEEWHGFGLPLLRQTRAPSWHASRILRRETDSTNDWSSRLPAPACLDRDDLKCGAEHAK